ncbi:glycoside hydrolase family 5 protein [Hortaea werneckii]|nr:glycoside hydrolase family 5 protein [Hortaea werneckii]
MRITPAVALVALTPPAIHAAPVPSLFGDIAAALQGAVGTVVTTITSEVQALSPLAQAVKKLGATLQTNANVHGTKLGCNDLTIGTIEGVEAAISHAFKWPFLNKKFIDWKTYKANGVNLGIWFEQEQNYDTQWWAENIGDFPDEWTWCGAVGFDVCGPKLEARYASWITTADIDKMGKLGINTLRIPTTYAAWVKVPGSQLYSGNQQKYLRTITNYAIDKYNMHVIIGLHSLPGGINTLSIGEAFGHDAWFQNSTNLDYSFRAIDSIISFIKNSGRPYGFTIAPLNEPSDNFAAFATPAGLTENGTNWINTYIKGTLDRIAKYDKRVPLMLQDAFFSEMYWSPFYPAGTNLVIDSHIYFFAAAGAYSQYVAPAICGQAKYIGEGDGKFPVFIGEWSLQSLYNNTLENRKTLYDTQVYAYQKYASGGAFWNYRMKNSVDTVDGEGVLQDYWSWEGLYNAGIPSANKVNSSYC